MTYPLIGNYGIVPGDGESKRAWLSGFIVREACAVRSNWRGTMDIQEWLEDQGVVGIQGIDTRALTRHLRINGSKHGVISSQDLDRASLARKLEHAPRIVGRDLVAEVSCEAPYEWTEPAFGDAAPRPAEFHAVVIDCGVKYNILRRLVSRRLPRDCRARVRRRRRRARNAARRYRSFQRAGDPSRSPTSSKPFESSSAGSPFSGSVWGSRSLGWPSGDARTS